MILRWSIAVAAGALWLALWWLVVVLIRYWRQYA
jgi:hypothetical protein